ncbi:hypothetical protein HDZ31DRAFT_69571, partial [Schizophyllum fasciatum]
MQIPSVRFSKQNQTDYSGDCAVDRATGEQQAAKDAQTKASDAHKNPVDPEVSDQEVQPKPAVRRRKDQVVLEMEGADKDAAGETEDSGNEAQTGGSAVQVPGEKKKVESGNEKTGEMSMDGTGTEFETKKRSEKTSNTPSATTRPKARSRGTRLEGKTADPNKSAGNLDNEETIKIVTKKGKKNEDGKANQVIGTEIEQVMRSAQFGWSRIPCIHARHLQFRTFTVEAYDKLQRKLSEPGVQHLYEKAKDAKQGLLTMVTDHALDIIVDRTLVDPASFTTDPAKLSNMLRPKEGLDLALAIAALIAGHHRKEALRRFWLELAKAPDEASITWTTDMLNLLDKRGTWMVRLWDKQILETSVWGSAIIQKLRSNDLTAQRPDTPARKTATLAASIDTRNVDAIQAAMFTTLHINKVKDAFHDVMGNLGASRNILVDLVKDPAYVETSELVEQFFDPAVWQVIGECWGELTDHYLCGSKAISRILANSSNVTPFYHQRIDTDNDKSLEANDEAFRLLYAQHAAAFNLLNYRMTCEERELYNLLTAASEAAIQQVPTMLEQFRAMVVRGILTGWRDYPRMATDPWAEYYDALTEAFDFALDAHHADKSKPAIQHPELVKNAVYNIANTMLKEEDGVGPLRWTTRLPLPCPSIVTAIMDVFSA